jgi:hypothetical protein
MHTAAKQILGEGRGRGVAEQPGPQQPQVVLAKGRQLFNKVVPDPPKQSSTIWPRREQSLMASATSATGLTVGCMASSSLRPPRKELTPT